MGAKTGTGGEWSKKRCPARARRANAPPEGTGPARLWQALAECGSFNVLVLHPTTFEERQPWAITAAWGIFTGGEKLIAAAGCEATSEGLSSPFRLTLGRNPPPPGGGAEFCLLTQHLQGGGGRANV